MILIILHSSIFVTPTLTLKNFISYDGILLKSLFFITRVSDVFIELGYNTSGLSPSYSLY